METDIASTREHYDQYGFCSQPSPFQSHVVDRVAQAMDAVMAGEYETGIAPTELTAANFDPADTIRDILNPHVANRDIYDFVTDAALAQTIARLMGAEALQIWGVQLFHKPPGISKKCNIGWHQDFYFHRKFFELSSEIFTAWIAISDVRDNCGPVRMVPGSHRWGFYDIQSAPREYLQTRVSLPPGETWREAPVLLAKGEFSLHHTLTYHGSYSNVSDTPRRSLALRLRTEKSELCAAIRGRKELDLLRDPVACPVIYGDRQAIVCE